MIKSIRAKLSSGGIELGDRGKTVSFNAVYEGTTELSELSENAIFGKATPAGYVQLTGADLPDFKRDEYYFDLLPEAPEDRDGILYSFKVRMAFRKEWNVSGGHNRYTDNRFAVLGDINGSMSLTIYNPVANEFLAANEELYVTIRKARGRRSDAEIELRRKELEKQIANVRNYNKDATDEMVAQYTAEHRRKLEIAEGNDPD